MNPASEFSEVQDTKLRPGELHFHQKPLESLQHNFPILLFILRERLHASSSIVLVFSYVRFGSQDFGKTKNFFSPFKTPKIDQSWPGANKEFYSVKCPGDGAGLKI